MQATAGAGKTTVLVERTEALFEKEGATVNNLLIVTFTNEAAKNLEKRLNLKPAKTERGGFRTFHSFCLNLVRQEARFLSYGLSENPLPEGPALSKLLLAAMKQFGVRRQDYDAVKAFISRHKRKRIAPSETEFENHEYSAIYSLYEQRLRDGGMLDFDGLIVEAVNLLESNSGVRERWQFKWVMVDEFQDTDDLQVRLLQLITEKHGNIMVVGDVNQSIYEFRGACPSNSIEFQKWFPNAKTLVLPENYRSTPEIVEYSRKKAPVRNELIEKVRTANPSGIKIEFRSYPTSTHEAEAILSVANQDPGNSAILARTNNQLGIYETLALQHGIKFFLLGKSGLWNKPEITALVGLAGFCMGSRQPEKYSEQLVSPYRANIRRLPPESGLREIMRVSNLESLYSNEDYSDNENFALINLRTVTGIAKKFSTLGEFLNHARKAAHASRRAKNAVTLGTIHAAKGLEFSNVFVVGVQAGVLPHKNATNFEEEARIFYVAMTRPKSRLRFSFTGTPSSFIEPDLTPEIRAEFQNNLEKVETIKRQQELFA